MYLPKLEMDIIQINIGKNLHIVGPLYGWYTFSKGTLIRTPSLFWAKCGP